MKERGYPPVTFIIYIDVLQHAKQQNKHWREKGERAESRIMQSVVVTTVMVVSVFLTVGLNTLVKANMSKGMSNYVFVAYSNLLGFCLLLIATTLHYRNRYPTPLNNSILFRTFLIGFFRYSNTTTLNVLFCSPVILGL